MLLTNLTTWSMSERIGSKNRRQKGTTSPTKKGHVGKDLQKWRSQAM